ncbi:unnamed protein product [Mucor hiemalis]
MFNMACCLKQKNPFHILTHYELYKNDRLKRGLPRQPMIVGVSGCQGSGKTTLCDTLVHLLKEEPYNLRVVNFSLDDLYLKHKDQVALSSRYSTNPLYGQRGQAGSHDLQLAHETFEKLLHSNQGPIPIPVYDKSLNNGQGDRLDKSQWKYPLAPFDIILFEGWMVGFKPVIQIKREKFQYTDRITVNDAKVMNEWLKQYEDEIYPYFDIFIHLSPADLNQVYQWRLQQEHHMKSTRGVNGLSDEQVKAFVETYMPAYELYLPRLDKVGFFSQGYEGESLKPYEGLNRLDKGYSQPNRHLRIVLDCDRRVTLCQPLPEFTIKEAQITRPNNKNNFFTKSLVYKCAFMGIVAAGIFGFKRHSIMNSFFKLSKRFNKK